MKNSDIGIIIKVAVVIALIAFGIYGFIKLYRDTQPPPAKIIYLDTSEVKIQEYEKQISSLQNQNKKLEADTIRYYTSIQYLLQRITADKSDTAQRRITSELLHKPDPTPVDVNIKIAQGFLCDSLLTNARERINNYDSLQRLQDTTKVEREALITGLLEQNTQDKNKISTQAQNIAITTTKKRRWRNATLMEGAAILTYIIFKFTIL